MENFEGLVKMINKADEENTSISISYSTDSDDISISMEIVPEILIMNKWVSIADKEKGMRTYFSFQIDSDVEYDDIDEEYTVTVGDGTLIIAEL